MGEASRNKSKQKTKEKEPSNVKEVTDKRIDILPKSEHLKKNVRMPKWLKAITRYFVGSYNELKQVRWPNRRATWGLTLAVILFTGAIIVFIIAIDYGFEQLFKQIIL